MTSWARWVWVIGALGCGAAPTETLTVPTTTNAVVTEEQVFLAAEAEVRAALADCPRASIVSAAARLRGDPPAVCADPAAAEASLRRAVEYLQLIASCREDTSADGCLGVAGPLPEPSVVASGSCEVERTGEVHAWREVALVLVQMVGVDCRIVGTTSFACGGPAEPHLFSVSTGALEISGGASRGLSLLDAVSALLDGAVQAGSAAVHVGVVGMSVGEAIGRSVGMASCLDVPRWRVGDGLAPTAVAGLPFTVSAPAGSMSIERGMVDVHDAQPLRIGASALPLDALEAALPAECHPIEGASHAYDCAGEALYSPSREIWVLVDLGDVRAVGIQRIRHDASPLTREGAVILLSSVRRRSSGAIDLTPLGVRAWPAELPVAYFAENGTRVLAGRIAPGAGIRTVSLHLEDDTGACVRARDVVRTPPRELFDTVARDDGGCELSEVASGPWGTILHGLRVMRYGARYLVVEHVAPTADGASARTELGAAQAALDALLPAPE